MKANVVHFKSMTVALKELEPFVRDGEHLQTGKAFKQFDGLRSRELLANWLVCAVLNSSRRAEDELIFTSDPDGGDGVIYDRANEKAWPTEHVLIPKSAGDEGNSAEALVLSSIAAKQAKGGSAYAAGKTLIVFLNAPVGTWHPNKVADGLPQVDFVDVWIVGLQGVEAGEYVYGVVRLSAFGRDVPTWIVRIAQDFASWSIHRIQ